MPLAGYCYRYYLYNNETATNGRNIKIVLLDNKKCNIIETLNDTNNFGNIMDSRKGVLSMLHKNDSTLMIRKLNW